MRFLCLAALVAATSAWGLTQTFRLMPPDRAFMNFALERYLHWHDLHFPPLWQELKVTDPSERQAVEGFIKKLDHWLVPGHPHDYQFKVGYTPDSKDQIHQSLRLYVGLAGDEDPFITRQKLPKDFRASFYELGPAQRRCWIGVTGPLRSPWELTRYCRARVGEAWALDGVESEATQRAPGFNGPFPSLWQVHTRRAGVVDEVRYFSDSTHPSGFPKALYRLINLHVTEGMLPANDFSQTRAGQKTIYFP